jgi:transposase InsO family protein
LLRTKDKAFGKLKEFKKIINNHKEWKIKFFRSDRNGEYFSKELSIFCEENEIIHQMTALYTPQHNGLAERKNGP